MATTLWVLVSLVQTGCSPEAPLLTPALVDVREVRATDFLVSGLPLAHYLEAQGSDLRLRDDVEVWIGEQQALVLRASAEGLHVRLSSPMPVGQYALLVSGPKELSRAAALEVVDGDVGSTDASVDASRDAGTDAAPFDAAPFDAAPFDAAPDGAPLDVAADTTGPDAAAPGFCDDVDLVACYEFESNGLDGSSFEYDLTLEDVDFGEGVSGEALALSEGSSVSVFDAPALSLSEFTVELWMLPNSLPADGRRGLADKNRQYGIFLEVDGTVRCTAGVGIAVSTLPVVVGEWTHVACTIGGGQLRIHRNGNRDSSADVEGSIPGGSAPFHLGEDSPDGGDQFLGRLDGVRVWSRARSDAELCVAAGSACAP